MHTVSRNVPTFAKCHQMSQLLRDIAKDVAKCPAVVACCHQMFPFSCNVTRCPHCSIMPPNVHTVKKFTPNFCMVTKYLYLFIYSGYFYIAFSSPLLLRGAPDIARILCRSFMPKRHRQLRVKDLPKVSTWRLERDSNPRPFRRKASNLLRSHHAPKMSN